MKNSKQCTCGSTQVLSFSTKCLQKHTTVRLNQQDTNEVPFWINKSFNYVKFDVCSDCGHMFGKWPILFRQGLDCETSEELDNTPKHHNYETTSEDNTYDTTSEENNCNATSEENNCNATSEQLNWDTTSEELDCDNSSEDNTCDTTSEDNNYADYDQIMGGTSHSKSSCVNVTVYNEKLKWFLYYDEGFVIRQNIPGEIGVIGRDKNGKIVALTDEERRKAITLGLVLNDISDEERKEAITLGLVVS